MFDAVAIQHERSEAWGGNGLLSTSGGGFIFRYLVHPDKLMMSNVHVNEKNAVVNNFRFFMVNLFVLHELSITSCSKSETDQNLD